MLRVCIRAGIRTIRKNCETLQGCMHSHKATSKHETLKAQSWHHHQHKKSPRLFVRQKCARPHSDTNCAHYALFLTHTSIPLHSLSSDLWDWAPLQFSHSAAAQWLLFGGTGCSQITSLADRLHKDAACSTRPALHSVHLPIHHLFVDRCFHWGLTSWSESCLCWLRRSKWLLWDLIVLPMKT